MASGRYRRYSSRELRRVGAGQKSSLDVLSGLQCQALLDGKGGGIV